MRINKYIAQVTGMSRRAADTAIDQGRVLVNGKPPSMGQQIDSTDTVTLDGRTLEGKSETVTILLNKPVGYVVSRDGQGNKSVYEVLPEQMHRLKPVGRLDKDSSGLLLLTNDGQLAQELTHPKFEKIKKYKIALNKDLSEADYNEVSQTGVMLEDGLSSFQLKPVNQQRKEWKVEMMEGRNRQIRRTFEALGYSVVKLHRTHFGPYELGTLPLGKFIRITEARQK